MSDLPASAVRFLAALGTPPEGSPSLLVQFVPFALILGIFYFIILLPMKKRQKRVAEFQSGLKPGDRVVTTSGIYGTIAKVSERSVSLQVADKVRIEVATSSIGGLQGQEPVVPESTSTV
ncbi:MAG: preprotein translocase subunit YajC [Vicinamibacterales bacterium]